MQSATEGLPRKDATIFKGLFRLYETKQYKKGINDCNQILKKSPDHAETNSMKGLFLYLTGDSDEGQKLAKNALMKNLKSELCWHILGIMSKCQKKYSEAIGCYKNALKYDPNNATILRDLAILQIHLRDLDGFHETRRSLLLAKSNLAINWIGLAVAEHLLGNYEQALKVLESFKNVIKNEEIKRHEQSELLLYEASIMLEMGSYVDVIKHLKKEDKSIFDRTAFNEYAVKAYLALKQLEKADPHIKFLLDKYPENLKMVRLLRERRGLEQVTNDNRQQIIELHNELIQTYPNSLALKRNQLKFLEGDQFRQKFDEYLRPFFIKELPSVFTDIRELLNDSAKAHIIEEVVVNHQRSLEEKGTFHGSETKEDPNCLLWSYYFLASFFNWKGDYKKAMDNIEKAIQHTPTFLELYIEKAKIFKSCHNYKLAAEVANKARTMDLADRFLNNLTVKYRIRNNEIRSGLTLLKEFVPDVSEVEVHDLQYMWYEYEVGNAHISQKQFGPGLRQFKFIESHFEDFYNDQYDFHSSCLTNYQLRAYINLLRHEDDVYNTKWYIKGTLKMIKALQEYEKQLPKSENKPEEEKKAEPKKFGEFDWKEKLDLEGKTYLAELKNPIDEACKFAKRLLNCDLKSPKYKVELYTEICLLYIRKGKYLLALKAYHKVANLANENIDVHLTRIRLIEELEKAVTNETLNADVKSVLEEELNDMKGGSDIKTIHQTVKNSSQKSLINEVKVLQADHRLNIIEKAHIPNILKDLILKYQESCHIKEVIYTLDIVQEEFGGDNELTMKIKESFKERFSFSPIFNEDALNIKVDSEQPKETE